MLVMAKILIVDDQPSYLRLIEKILTQHNHTVTKVNNAVEALDTLKNGTFDLLLTDAIMPGPTGFDLISTIRNTANIKDLPIIMLTAKREQKDVEKGILFGVNDYVVKPVHPEILIEKIAALLAKTSPTSSTFVVNKVKVGIAAHWQDTTTVVEVSETGMLLESNFAVPIGFPLRIKSDVFKQIGVGDLTLIAFECLADRTKPGTFQVHVIYADPSPQDRLSIGNWIFSQHIKKAS